MSLELFIYSELPESNMSSGTSVENPFHHKEEEGRLELGDNLHNADSYTPELSRDVVDNIMENIFVEYHEAWEELSKK